MLKLTRKHLMLYCSLGSMHVVSGTIMLTVNTCLSMFICGVIAFLCGAFLVTASIYELLT
jgi:hypothetical protein